jgi:hypothetical protein
MTGRNYHRTEGAHNYRSKVDDGYATAGSNGMPAGSREEQLVNDSLPAQAEPLADDYEPPKVTEIGQLMNITKGAYSRTHSDDGDAGGYWDK